MSIKASLIQAAKALSQHKLSEATTACMAILKNHPKASDAWQILSMSALKQGNIMEALGFIDKAIFINPQEANYFNIRGVILKKARYYQDGIKAIKNAIKINPHSSDFYYNLGTLYQGINSFEDAKTNYETAHNIDPSNPKILMNLGALLRDNYCYEEALEKYNILLQIDPKNHGAMHGKGIVYKRKNHLKTAKTYYKKAMALDPFNKNYNFSLALIHLQEGNFLDGWREYEYRIQLSNFDALRPHIQQPQWEGQWLSKDESLLLWAEQGFGDTLTFIRYLPLIQERCPRIHLLCHAELKTLFEQLPGISSIIPLFKEKIPHTTYQLPLLSAAHVFKTTRDTIPNRVPYLHAPPQIISLLHSNTFKVGIVWRGKPIPNKERSCNLKNFIPLFNLPDICFFSLQLGKEAEQLKKSSFKQYPIEDLSPHIKDFKDTAALLTELDLLITIDTAIAHLAGALNCPTWVLLQKYVDWRWQPEKETSDWYPSHRLFRQKKQGQWDTVFIAVAQALKDTMGHKK